MSVARAEQILKEAKEFQEKELRRIAILTEHKKLYAGQVARIREDLKAITGSWRGFVPAANGVEGFEVLGELSVDSAFSEVRSHIDTRLTGIRAVNPKYGLVLALVDESRQSLIPRIRETIEAAVHPRPIEPFELGGFVVLSSASGQFLARFVFKGFTPKTPCACAPGGRGHRYQVVDTWVSTGLWSFGPGEKFDAPPKTEEELAIYVKARRVIDLFAEEKRAKDLVENPPPPPPDPVEEAIKAFRGSSAAPRPASETSSEAGFVIEVPAKPKDRQSGATTKEGRSR